VRDRERSRREEVRVPTYETLFITPPNLTEEEESTTVDTMAKLVSDGGGTFTSNDRMGRRRLAYPIKKFTDGVYVRFLYDSDAAVPKELERRMRLSDSVLRSLTVRLERDEAVAAKEQAVRDAEARVEAARREAEERERIERERAEAAARGEVFEEPPPRDPESRDEEPREARHARAEDGMRGRRDEESDDEEADDGLDIDDDDDDRKR
jgi:small subunit ribosomal protein S6